jgi:DNA replication protein DnaC
MKELETKSSVLLKHYLKAMKLPTMTAECEKVAARCARENVDHLEFLLQLCELELLDRERRAAAQRLKAARFPTPKALDSFDFAAAPSVNKPLILELMRCDYIDRRANVLLIGGSGSGKTHLATALAMEACACGKRARFFRVTELATLLLEARVDRQLTRLRSQPRKLDLLVLMHRCPPHRVMSGSEIHTTDYQTGMRFARASSRRSRRWPHHGEARSRSGPTCRTSTA